MKRLKKLFTYMSGYKAHYILSIVCLLFSQILISLTPLVIKTTIDSVLSSKASESHLMNSLILRLGGSNYLRENLYIMGLIIIAISLLRGLFLFLKNFLGNKASENTIKKLRDDLYDHIQRLPYDYHVKTETGELLQKSTSDIETIRRFLSIQLLEFIGASFMIIFVIFTIFSLNSKMALVSICILPITFAFSYLFFKKVKKQFSLVEEAEAQMTTKLQENLNAVRVVKAFSNQNHEIDQFELVNSSFKKKSYGLVHSLAYFWGISDFISLMQVFTIVILGAYFSFKGEISLGTYAAFITYINMLVWPVRQMGRNLTDMGKANIAFSRIQDILELETEDYDSGLKDFKIEGSIVFDNVSFSYDSNKDVLKNISFSINPGETLAILGPTGSGKSTLVHLLPRLYEYKTGSIKIDGFELRDINKKYIRNNIGLILQEPFLYARTVMDNVKFTNPELSDLRAYDATKTAHIHQDILDFEGGYETLVGEKGSSLSGGQKQRLAIARTIIEDRPIVLFDDSLSAVDSETDLSIRKSLELRENKATTIIISHRIATACQADKIIVLDHGEIKEAGSHQELLAQEGAYKNIYQLQNSINID